MAQMIRKQIYIDADHEQFLKERSMELGVTEAEVVRQALADARQKAQSGARQRAFDDLISFIREHRMSDVPKTDSETRWAFNREELYDDMYEERFERPRRRREAAAEHTAESSTV